MPARKLKEFLDGQKIKYISISHSPAYTAQEIAAAAHIKGKEVAKSVMVQMDGKMVMIVLPASHQVDFEKLKRQSGAKEVRLATEDEFKDLFPDCDIGAMPPFGQLYGFQVYSSETLAQDEEIAFNAGSHSELIRLAYRDYERLVKPRVGDFSRQIQQRVGQGKDSFMPRNT